MRRNYHLFIINYLLGFNLTNQAFFLFLLGTIEGSKEFQEPSVELRGFHETLEPSWTDGRNENQI